MGREEMSGFSELSSRSASTGETGPGARCGRDPVTGGDLAELALAFSGRPPRPNASNCLNHRHRGAGCRRCELVCPVAAISILDTAAPSLDESSCLGCGACSAVCPTEALTETTDLIRSVGRTCRSIDGDLTLSCPVNPYSSSGPVVELGACLASLDAPALIGLCGDGRRSLYLDVRRCGQCPIGSLTRQIGVAVAEANLVLSAVSRPPVIEMIESPSAMESATTRSGERIGGTHLSRRGLFGMFRDEETGVSDRRSSPEVPTEVPGRRRRLLRRLGAWEVADHAELDTAGTSFASVEVDPMTCSLCGLCATFCPTGALTMVEDAESPGEVILGFTASFCLDCGICSVACPEHAIGFGPTVRPAAIAQMTVTPLLRDRLLCCGKCGLPTRRRPEDQTVICFSCRQGAGPVDSLRDGAGLMGDLLGRIGRPADPSNGLPTDGAGEGKTMRDSGLRPGFLDGRVR